MKVKNQTIEGLRAISIVAIIFYHAKLNFSNSYFLPGGYLGIDIFFILTGYLSALKLNSEKSKISFRKFLFFLDRRLKRVLPSLLFMTLVTYFFFLNIFVPEQLLNYSDSIIASNLFLSNYFFYYLEFFFGENNTLLVPFFHTSFLSIFIQGTILIIFIFIFTIFIKKKNFLYYFVFLLFVFYIFSHFIIKFDQKFYFIDIVSRLWEIIFGIIIYYLDKKKIFNKYKDFTKNILIFLSFIIIIYYFINFELDSFKTLYQIIPFIFSVGLIILLKNSDNILLSTLNNKYIYFLGTVSFSLYIWHFPYFAYLRLDWIENLSFSIKIISSLFILLVSIFSYYFIEKPFRNYQLVITKNFYLIISIFFIIVFTQNIFAHKNNGFYKKFMIGNTDISNSLQKNILSEKFIQNSYGDNYDDKIIVIGNEQGKDTYNSFFFNKELFTNYNFIYIKEDIENFLLKYKKDENFKKNIDQSKWIIISTRWSEQDLAQIKQILDKFRNKIILFSQAPEFPENIIKYKKKYTIPEITVYKNYLIKNGINISQQEIKELERVYFENLYFYDPSKYDIALKLENIAITNQIIFIDKAEHLCDFLKKRCIFLTPKSNNEILFNYSNFSREGAEYIGKKYYNSLKNILYDN